MTLFKIKQKIGETFEIDVKEDGSKIECSLPTCKDSTICKHVFLASREKCIKEYEKEGIYIQEIEKDRIKTEWAELPRYKRVFI